MVPRSAVVADSANQSKLAHYRGIPSDYGTGFDSQAGTAIPPKILKNVVADSANQSELAPIYKHTK
jgi:hypothetical protein